MEMGKDSGMEGVVETIEEPLGGGRRLPCVFTAHDRSEGLVSGIDNSMSISGDTGLPVACASADRSLSMATLAAAGKLPTFFIYFFRFFLSPI